MANRRALDDEGLASVREQLAAGASLTDAAAALGISYKTVQSAARALGVRPATRARPVYSSALRAQAVQRYARGESAGEVARSLGTSDSWVLAQVKKAGVDVRRPGKLADRREEVERRYLAGQSTADIAADLQVSDVAISRQLALGAVRLRQPGWKARKHQLRDDAFAFAEQLEESELDQWRPDAAYWAGFLMADGTVSDTGRITLALAARDEEQIRAWLAFLGCPDVRVRIEAVRFRGGEKFKARAQVSSRRLAADLARHGIVPRKTNAGRPASAALAATPGFWRGMVDGDGTITMPKGKHGPSLALVGSPIVMDQYANFLHTIIGGRRPRVLDAGDSKVIKLVKVEGVRAREAVRTLWADVLSPLDGSSAPALRRKLDRVNVASTWETRTEKDRASAR